MNHSFTNNETVTVMHGHGFCECEPCAQTKRKIYWVQTIWTLCFFCASLSRDTGAFWCEEKLQESEKVQWLSQPSLTYIIPANLEHCGIFGMWKSNENANPNEKKSKIPIFFLEDIFARVSLSVAAAIKMATRCWLSKVFYNLCVRPFCSWHFRQIHTDVPRSSRIFSKITLNETIN